ncbi:ArgE/DapE family deacylase [Alteribacillus sp. HJP-4]|uniref:ArgE/DapE family deacylase n=1 Tax=Alteribacillus sp. HJP-4 TaxID=2775394 RepID=UPI0035CCD641
MNFETVQSKINEEINKLWKDEINFLQTLGRYRSTLGNEQAIQNFLVDYFSSNLEMEVDQFTPDIKSLAKHPGFSVPEWSYDGRSVVVAKSTSNNKPKGKSVIFQGHVDVVSPGPLEDWTYDPWSSTISGGKMFGRGLQDMKSGITAMIFAYKAIRSAGFMPAADFFFQTVIEEECTGNGALAALERGYSADAAIIPEPFGLQATYSQVGVIWLRITVKGAGAHTERASEAVNAIEKSYIMIEALRQYRKYINEQPKHPDFKDHPHPLNVNIGTIQSGEWPSNVPSKAVLEARVGFYPGQDPNIIKKEVKEWILKAAEQDDWLRDCKPEITFFGFHAEGYSIDDQTELFQKVDRSHEVITGSPPKRAALTCTTDARFYNLYYNIPALCYGPAGGNMHGIDEWVDLESVKKATKVYAHFISNWCGLEPTDRGESPNYED